MSRASKSTRREMQRRAIGQMVAHTLFRRMITRQGIALAACSTSGLETKIPQALRKCELCADTQVCRGWLQSDGPCGSYIAFCPNAEFIETCRILDPNAMSLDSDVPETFIRREPTLAEILAEPIIKLVMASDHVGAARRQEPSPDVSEAPNGEARRYGYRCAKEDGAVIAEDPVVPEALSVLRQEHRNMAILLLTLEWQVNRFENDNQPDYDVIGAILDYFLSFPDVYHHPKEELIFAKLHDRDLRIAQHIGDLRIAHQELAARAREFGTALRAVIGEAEVSRVAFAGLARGFIDLQRRHIDIEESTFFPAAAKALTAQDWAALRTLMTTGDDPLIGEQAGERFEQLRKTILGWQAQDQAAPAKV